MSFDEKKNKLTTIAELVSVETGNNDDPGPFFQKKAAASADADPIVSKNHVPVLDRLRSANMLVPGGQLEDKFFDEYRRIKRPLLSNAFGKTAQLVDKGNLILVTSSIPGEGKSYSSANLALSIAQELDHTVLLVDCDVARHGSSCLFGIAEKPGLMELLESESLDAGAVILRTDIPKLCLISAGKQHALVTELLASQRMAEVVSELGTRYHDRIIIFDGPPLLSTPQSQVMTGLVGQIVFVIEVGNTPQAVVQEALSLIPKDHAAGLLLNKNQGILSKSGYHGTYGYYGPDRE